MKKIVFLAFLLVCHTAVGQVIKGTLYNADNNQPLEFVNIGIVGKNVGTVADLQGRFSLLVDAAYDDETIEHVKDLGEGFLHFCAGLTHKTYYRKTSQGVWQTAPVGISISVIADVEK